MKGERNEHLLKDAKLIGKAMTKPIYNLFCIDAHFIFPAIIDEGTLAVKGEVYEVPVSALPDMDRIEGHPNFYCRKPIELCEVESGDQVWFDLLQGDRHLSKQEVIAYFFVDKEMLVNRKYKEIKSGDWLNR